jgi:3-phenylpropionate/trans-cinnamate dioxygenase ferredoxin subunit
LLIPALVDNLPAMEFVKVATVADIPPGERSWFEFEEETLIVFNVDGEFYCVADLCTHDGGPLEFGELYGYEVECPRHGARFDIRNGKAVQMPAVAGIPTYAVKVEGEDLYVESPDEF